THHRDAVSRLRFGQSHHWRNSGTITIGHIHFFNPYIFGTGYYLIYVLVKLLVIQMGMCFYHLLYYIFGWLKRCKVTEICASGTAAAFVHVAEATFWVKIHT